MPGHFKNQDLRVLRTRKAILDALPCLLQKRTFNRITVNDLCEEALLSRVAFYSHFRDKYDLLEQWLTNLSQTIKKLDYATHSHIVDMSLRDNKKLISNIYEDANEETQKLITKFLLSIVNIPKEIDLEGKPTLRHTILSKFIAGGMASVLSMYIKNNFSLDLKAANTHVDEIIKLLLESKEK